MNNEPKIKVTNYDYWHTEPIRYLRDEKQHLVGVQIKGNGIWVPAKLIQEDGHAR